MLTLLSYLLVIVGLVTVILPMFTWVRIIKPRERQLEAGPWQAGPWDVLVELAKRAPWLVLVGLILIYLALKILDVPLPF
jgi:hypothetical protein